MRQILSCLILFCAFAGFALAVQSIDQPFAELKLTDGRVLRNAKLKSFNSSSVFVKDDDGMAQLPYELFPGELQPQLAKARAATMASDVPGISVPAAESRPEAMSALAMAREKFSTRLVRQDRDGEPAPMPPPELQTIVYPTSHGPMAAYLSTAPGDGLKRPAIIWIVGGFSNSISDVAWDTSPVSNDQSARVFREAGIITLYPSLRGGNDSPGFKEGFFGEVNDVIDAAKFLAKQNGVDPTRIYLGGHSTGGTLVLLVAECTLRFRAVFAFGPVSDPAVYGPRAIPYDSANPTERSLRAPVNWLQSLFTPTFILEGDRQPCNASELGKFMAAAHNDFLHVNLVQGGSHFSTLAPVSHLIAEKIRHDTGSNCLITFDPDELANAVRNQ